MLDRAFTFDVHEEQSGVIKKEMVVQSGNAQAAFYGGARDIKNCYN
jgi:hypothetical protein